MSGSFTGLKSGRLSSLANRMLSESSEAASGANPNPDQSAQMSSIKRNLFGCRLDHEQLHADLQQMLAEQRRVKSAQWSFDFENLRPISDGRVEWRRVRVPVKPSASSSGPSGQDRDDDKYLIISATESEDDDDHEEEDDEALAVPEFYKRQRRFKLAEVDKNRLNVLANTNPSNNQKPANVSAEAIPTATKTPTTPIKPKVSRPSRKITQFDQLGKILTYSENRKDTLRSASASNHRQPNTVVFKQSTNSAFTQSARKPRGKSRKPTTGDDRMRQQTLHDLNVFKQRKKRQPTMDAEAKHKAANAENPHYLRSHSNTSKPCFS